MKQILVIGMLIISVPELMGMETSSTISYERISTPTLILRPGQSQDSKLLKVEPNELSELLSIAARAQNQNMEDWNWLSSALKDQSEKLKATANTGEPEDPPPLKISKGNEEFEVRLNGTWPNKGQIFWEKKEKNSNEFVHVDFNLEVVAPTSINIYSKSIPGGTSIRFSNGKITSIQRIKDRRGIEVNYDNLGKLTNIGGYQFESDNFVGEIQF